MDNELILSKVKASIPALAQELAYDKKNNLIVTKGIISSSAHYIQGSMFSESIAIVFDLAYGYKLNFLNGAYIYGSAGEQGTVLLDYHDPGQFNGWSWTSENLKAMACIPLKRIIANRCAVLGIPMPGDNQLQYLAEQLYAEATRITKEAGSHFVQHSNMRYLG